MRARDDAGEARQQAALAQLGELALDTEAPDSLLEAACALVQQALACDASAIAERAGEELVLRASAGLPPEDRQERLARPGRGAPAFHLGPLGFGTGVEVQLPGRLRPPLVLGAYRRAARPLGAAAVHFLEGVARLLSAALARQRAERDLVDRERLLLAAFEAQPEAELLVDEAGAIREASAAACRLLGLHRRGLVGRRFTAGGGPLDGAGLAAAGEQVVALAAAAGRPLRLQLSRVASIAPGFSAVRLRPAAAQPEARSSDRAEDAPARPGPPGGTRARVLVIDDEPLVGTALARTLGDDHDVTVVGDPREALALIEDGARFDAILSDLLMPGMTGIELYRTLARSHPAQARRIAFLTGGTFDAEARAFLQAEGIPWLEKPFELGALRALVAERLAC